jgi:SAM domain (Sterile alpha motif)
MDAVEWLEALRLGQYAQAFAENDIDLAIPPQLSDADLKELGVIRRPMGNRGSLILGLLAQT